MKKTLIILSYVAVFLIGGVFFSNALSSGNASDGTKTITVSALPLKYYVNQVEKRPAAGEQGFIYEGTTYVPLRFIGESLDKTVSWTGSTRSIYINDKPGTTPQVPTTPVQKPSEQPSTTPNKNFDYLGDNNIPHTGENIVRWNEKVVTNKGDSFSNSAHIFRRDSTSSVNETYRGHIVYNTNEIYTKFEAHLAPNQYWYGTTNGEYIGKIRVYADDRFIAESQTIQSNLNAPVKFEADISGAKKVKIEYEGKSLNVIEPKFIKK